MLNTGKVALCFNCKLAFFERDFFAPACFLKTTTWVAKSAKSAFESGLQVADFNAMIKFGVIFGLTGQVGSSDCQIK